jgi:hypothetical protein
VTIGISEFGTRAAALQVPLRSAVAGRFENCAGSAAVNTKVVRDLLGYQLAVFVAAPPAVASCAPAWGASFAARLAELVRIADANDDVSQPKRRKTGKGRTAKPEATTPVGLHAVLLALCGSTVPADLPFYELFVQLLAVACTLPVWMRTLPVPPGARRPIL